MDKKNRILLVDDETDFSDPVAYFFESNGYSVSKASNGEGAVKAVKEDRPDIVFLDIILPDLDGIAVLKRIREINQSLPVVMMSAYVKDDRIEKQINLYENTAIFYKSENLSRAMALVESALKKEGKPKQEAT